MAEKITLKNVRIAYPHVFTPDTSKVANGRYTVTLLLPEDDPQVAEVEKIVEDIKTENKAAVAKAKDKFGEPLHRGLEGYPGMIVLRAKTKTKPQVLKKIGGVKQLITDESEVYGGCWCAAIVGFFFYDNAGNRGIGVSFDALMKRRDDEKLAVGVSTDSFDELEDTQEASEDDLL